MQSLNITKKLLPGIFSAARRPHSAALCTAVTIEEIYEDDTGEELFDETGPMNPIKIWETMSPPESQITDNPQQLSRVCP